MHIRRFGLLLTAASVVVVCLNLLHSQELPIITTSSNGPQTGAPDAPPGVEVQARGPVHEAFATPTAEAKATYGVPKKPPAQIEEMPPDEKPEGDAVWLGGYWAWDDDRTDFLWVSGCWRIRPPGKDWVPGYWREQGGQHQWVPGFWTAAQETQAAPQVTYYPEPPAPPQLAPPPAPPEADMFYVPGYWMWSGDHYVWRAGYHTRVRQGHVYVASHYRWTPFGYVFVAGYWDYTVARRGVLYAPIVVDHVVVGPRFVYTPYYAVTDTIVVDAFFVRPGFCHYYFGDYYGPRYASIGFECGFHYSRRHYDPIVTYSRWEYRNTPGWYDTRLSITIARNSGRAPLPPRTLIQQNNVTNITNINNVTINNNTNIAKTTVLAPAKTVVAARGAKTVPVDTAARMKVKESSVAMQKASLSERSKAELGPQARTPSAMPRTAALNLPQNAAPAKGAGVGPKNPPMPAKTALPKNQDLKGSPGAPQLTTKGPGPGNPNKTKAPEGANKGAVPGEGTRPVVARPPMPPDRPAPPKRAPEEKKKKGG